MGDPTRFLTEPEPEESISKGYFDLGVLWGMVSPSYWLNDIIGELTGYNPSEVIGEKIAGNWEAFAKAGVAIENLGKFNQEFGINLYGSKDKVAAAWQGHAADAAYNYFTTVAVRTARMQEVYEEIGKAYADAAVSMFQIAAQIKTLLETVADFMFAALAAEAIGDALIETGVGPLAGTAVAGLEIAEAADTMAKASLVGTSPPM